MFYATVRGENLTKKQLRVEREKEIVNVKDRLRRRNSAFILMD